MAKKKKAKRSVPVARAKSKAHASRGVLSNATYNGYLGKMMPSKTKRPNNEIGRELFERRLAMQSFARYGTKKDGKHAVRYFRPKLMVDVKSGTVYASPLAGGSYKVNPKRKTMKKRKKARKSIAHFFKKNPSRRKSYRRNPIALKQIVSKQNIITVASLGIGFIGGIKAQKYVNSMAFLANYRRFTGIVPFILGGLLTLKSSKQAVKNIGLGIALSGAYDLVTQNIPQLKLTPVEGVDLDDNTYAGTVVDVNGQVVDLQGEDIIVGEDVSVVGESDSPYMMI